MLSGHSGSECRCSPYVATVAKISAETGVPASTYWRLIRQGRLRGIRIRGVRDTLISRRDLELLVAEAISGLETGG